MAVEGRSEALARYYDLDLADEHDDVSLYLALAARTGGPVLELAAGTGRISIPLAVAGYKVTALDVDRHMLDRARAAWQDARHAAPASAALDFVEADMLDVRVDHRFALVILALNTLLMLPGRGAQAAALATMAHHLLPTGRAVVDVWLPSPEDLAAYDGRLTAEWIRQGADGGEMVAKMTSSQYDPATASATVHTVFDAWPPDGGPLRRTSRHDALHFVSESEARALVRGAGMRVESAAGDHAMSDFGPGSERVVLVCALL